MVKVMAVGIEDRGRRVDQHDPTHETRSLTSALFVQCPHTNDQSPPAPDGRALRSGNFPIFDAHAKPFFRYPTKIVSWWCVRKRAAGRSAVSSGKVRSGVV